MFSIFFAYNFGNVFLILRILLVIVDEFVNNAWGIRLPIVSFSIGWENFFEEFWYFLDFFARMGGKSLTKLAGLSTYFSFLHYVLISCNFGVNLATTFCLKEQLSLSVIKEFHPNSYKIEIKFHSISPILFIYITLFVLLQSILLFLMYNIIHCNNNLMFFEFEERYSSNLWSKME